MKTYGHFVGGKHVPGSSGAHGEVFWPMTGEVPARGRARRRTPTSNTAVENGMAAQPTWAATNPQRRARVLINSSSSPIATSTIWPNCWRRARQDPRGRPGRYSARARSRRILAGAPQILKGEFTEGAGPGIDVYSMRQPFGVGAGITPFNFPAMIPMWKFGPAIAAAMPSFSSPPSAIPGAGTLAN